MGFVSIFKKILGFLAGVFAGRTWDIAAALQGDVQEIVARLMDSTLKGPERFESAMTTLKAIAAQRGIDALDHALSLLIELEVTEQHDDRLEDFLDEDILGTAREIVQGIDARDLVSNAARRNAALEELKERFIAEGRTKLLSTHVLNLLIELAVANLRR